MTNKASYQKEIPRAHNSKRDIKVSVTLTVYNEGHNISKVIESFFRQTYKPNEIVVCDGGSTDDTVMRLQEIVSEDIPLKILIASGACRGKGRNLAIDAAQNPIVVLTDGGIIADSKWLERLLSPCINNPDIQVVYGTVMPQITGIFSRCLAALTIKNSHIDGKLCPSVASLLLYKKVWFEVGGFPENLSTVEDLIFLERLKDHSASSTKALDAIVYWSLSQNLGILFRKLSVYSRGALSAGFAKDWHYAVFRNYLIFSFLFLTGIFFFKWFLLSLPLFQVLRVHNYLNNVPWSKPNNFFQGVVYYIVGAIILMVMDLSMWYGLFLWIIKDHCHYKEIATHKKDFE